MYSAKTTVVWLTSESYDQPFISFCGIKSNSVALKNSSTFQRMPYKRTNFCTVREQSALCKPELQKSSVPKGVDHKFLRKDRATCADLYAQMALFICNIHVGKTHLATALCVKACHQGVKDIFINCHDLIQQLKSTYEKGTLERGLKRYANFELLIIDENRLLACCQTRGKSSCGNENHGLGPWFRRASSGVLKNPR